MGPAVDVNGKGNVYLDQNNAIGAEQAARTILFETWWWWLWAATECSPWSTTFSSQSYSSFSIGERLYQQNAGDAEEFDLKPQNCLIIAQTNVSHPIANHFISVSYNSDSL